MSLAMRRWMGSATSAQGCRMASSAVGESRGSMRSNLHPGGGQASARRWDATPWATRGGA